MSAVFSLKVCSRKESSLQSGCGSYTIWQFEFQLQNVPNPTLVVALLAFPKQKGRNSDFLQPLTVPMKQSLQSFYVGIP